MKRLKDILSYKRPHESTSERQFIDRFLGPYAPARLDHAALVIEVAGTAGRSRTLFSSHVDTVHLHPGRQTVHHSEVLDRFYKRDGEPLGADDGAGVWVMLEMIDHGVPGTYVFHRGEERGGLGSKHIARTHADWLRGFDRAVAFDRRLGHSVITHQRGERCCSEDFAEALAAQLGADGLEAWEPDDTGVFTDTACYTPYIPECTNVSCGYEHEHSGREILDIPTVMRLRQRCLAIDWEALPLRRLIR